MKKLLSILLTLFFAANIALSQSTDETISTAIKVGNYKELSKHFDTKVELTIASKEDNYSKAQAELIMKDFFAKIEVSNYQVIHKGKSPDGAKYAIGTLETSNEKYRTYILTKDVRGSTRIQQLRFETSE